MEAVDKALSEWRQGDCVVGEQWFLCRFKSDLPLTDDSREVAGEGVDLAESAVRGFAVLTQTCDIVRSCGKRPYVEVAPLVEIDSKQKLRGIQRGHMPRFGYIPGVADMSLVADLDRVMTAEKWVVASWERTPGWERDDEARHIARALARKRTRFAFPDDFGRLAQGLHQRLQDKHDKNSPEGSALRALREIRVRAVPSWEADKIEITFWFIRNEDQWDFDGQSWHSLLDRWLDLVPASGRFVRVDGSVTTLSDLTAKDYVESDPLDLDHLSTRDR